MKISELPKLLSLIPPTQAVLILGPPGVGKSTMIRQFAEDEAKKLDREFVDYNESDDLFLKVSRDPEKYYVFLDFRLSEAEPTDFLGVPRDADGFVIYKPLRWVQVFSHPKAAGMLFLDELTNIRREDVLAQAYKLILDRKAGFLRFAQHVRIVAAGNDPQHAAIANMLPAPLTNRFAVFYVSPPDVIEWTTYVDMCEGGVDPRVAGYLLRYQSDLLHKSEPETLENFPTPRTWSRLNQILKNDDITNLKMIKEIAEALLGKEVAHKFATFCKLSKYLPSPEEILRNPDVLDRRDIDEKELTKLDLYYYAIAVVSEHIKKIKEVLIDDVIRFSRKIFDYQADLLIVFLKMLPKERKGTLVLKLSDIPEVRDAVSSIAKYL